MSVPTHLFFDLLAYVTGGLLTWCLATRFLRGIPHPVPSNLRWSYAFVVLNGVIIGSFLIGTIPFLQPGENHELLGKSILGAIVGGIAAAEIFKIAMKIRGSTGMAFVPGLAAGIFVGRWGCFFTGLPDNTYGTVTTLPWGVDFGDGLLRHPVQLYEGFTMLAFLIIYLIFLFRRHPFVLRSGFYIFCIVYGTQRFLWEFLKPYPHLIGPLGAFQLFCLGLVLYGTAMILFYGDRRRHA